MLPFVQLAEVSHRKRQLRPRDKLLVLAAAEACREGWPEVAERCRELVLAHNPRHLIGRFDTVADALRNEEFQFYLRQLARFCTRERAEFHASRLGLDEAEDAGLSPGEAALRRLHLPIWESQE